MIGIDSVADLLNTVVSRVWPDATEKERAKLEVLKQQLDQEFQLQLQQLQTNVEEAKSENVFVAGWRPFVGWTCGVGFGYEFVARPLINGFLGLTHVSATFPGIEVETVTSLLLGLLGLGALRTVEKVKGVVRS